MSTVAETARAASTRSRTAARPRLLGGGVLWIVLFATLLAGVVAVNVTVLRLNLELDEVGRERAELRGTSPICGGSSPARPRPRGSSGSPRRSSVWRSRIESIVFVRLRR